MNKILLLSMLGLGFSLSAEAGLCKKTGTVRFTCSRDPKISYGSILSVDNEENCEAACAKVPVAKPKIGTVDSKAVNMGDGWYMVKNGNTCYKEKLIGFTPSGSMQFSTEGRVPLANCNSFDQNSVSKINKKDTVAPAVVNLGGGYYQVSRNGKCYRQRKTGTTASGSIQFEHSNDQIDCKTHKPISVVAAKSNQSKNTNKSDKSVSHLSADDQTIMCKDIKGNISSLHAKECPMGSTLVKSDEFPDSKNKEASVTPVTQKGIENGSAAQENKNSNTPASLAKAEIKVEKDPLSYKDQEINYQTKNKSIVDSKDQEIKNSIESITNEKKNIVQLKNDLKNTKDKAEKEKIKEKITLAKSNLEAAEEIKKKQVDAQKDAKKLSTTSSYVYTDEITTEGDAKNGDCGKYGGEKCSKTRNQNQLIAVGQTLLSVGGNATVATVGSNAKSKVDAKGMNATQVDVIDANIKTSKSAVLTNTTLMTANAVAAAYQLKKASDHSKSAKNVELHGKQVIGGQVSRWDGASNALDTSDSFKQAYQASLLNHEKNVTEVKNQAINNCLRQNNLNQSICTNDYINNRPEVLAAIKVQQETANSEARKLVKKYVNENSQAEQEAQLKLANEINAAALQSVSNIANHYKGMQAAKAAIKLANAQKDGVTSGFVFNPGNGNPSNPTDPVLNTPTDPGSLQDDEKLDLADTGPMPDQFNPGSDGTDGQGAPQAGAFVPGAPQGGAGNNSLSTGSAGGTSAAKEDGSKKEQTGPEKNQTGGMYAAGDGSGSTFSRSGGSAASAPADNGFADMLKKFLPGEDEDKKAAQQNAIAFDNDRSPAADKAAVMGRNKDIFNEIHKRYEKKNSEGALSI